LKLLAQHPDFAVLIQNTAAELKIRPELVLKDYWVTAVLRLLAASPFRGRFLFKGGTSLSKGWKLIDRFSEDIDLLLTGSAFSAPPDRKGERERMMKEMRDYISAHLPLSIPDLQDKYFYKRDDWHMEARYVWTNVVPPPKDPEQTVFVEAGFRGGANPHGVIPLNSMVGDYLLKHQLGEEPSLQEYRPDFVSFELELLSPARTFFEKLLHIYAKLGTDVSQLRTRHIYDVVQIYRNFPEVRALISSGEYLPILREAIDVSNQWYNANLTQEGLDLHAGLQISAEQARILERAYVEDAAYYFRGQVPFGELRKGLEAIRVSFTHIS
jgi:predicted nucleotidyltransferase component of viral defense system